MIATVSVGEFFAIAWIPTAIFLMLMSYKKHEHKSQLERERQDRYRLIDEYEKKLSKKKN